MLRHVNEASIEALEHETPAPALTVIVPTRNEAGNIEALVARLDEALGSTETEILFVDDSDDDTPEVVERVAGESSRVIRLIHRGCGARRGGLGGAVVAGLRAARAEWVCVMDADLQHPPELVPELFRRARAESRDLVVASRYCADGNAGTFTRARALVSRATTGAAKSLFPRRLKGVSDPMSGFFLIRRDAVDVDALRPHGFKILLEIVARTPRLRTGEVPLHFGERFAGDSKASFREGMRYLTQLTQLRLAGIGRFSRFGVVGLTGLAVNMIVLAALTDLFGLYYLASAILATQASTGWNYLLTDHWVFAGRDHRRKPWERAALFFAMNNAALLIRGPILFVLTSMLGVNYLVSNFISLAAMTLLRFLLADLWIWGGVLRRRQLAAFFYDVHGIVTVSSDVRLPELEGFRSEGSGATAMIRVRTGRLRATQNGDLATQNGDLATQNGDLATQNGDLLHALSPHVLQYDERLGPLGFGMRIEARSSIDVLASPLLRRSPHVLYTNVVEPILRWTFVEKGYALVHGACITAGDDAYMITARTDTGKTTTILKTLAQSRGCGFVSDDLTLVAPDGRVFTYPKPLTISRHTVAALENTQLSRRQRVTLILQSRVHSRSGRKFAFLLTRSGLPVATINAIVQLIVPPPKYHVEQLVPGVLKAQGGKLAGLVVIERGGDGETRLEDETALDILLENCEDAYGFPPYDQIEQFLHSRNGTDLRVAERSIIGTALRGRPATLLASSTMDWYKRLPGVISSGHSVQPRFENGAYDEESMATPMELSPRMGLVE
jgi:dolichol-phosphate mannosyltransferase